MGVLHENPFKWHAKTLRITLEKAEGLTEFATCVSKLCKCLLSIYLLSHLRLSAGRRQQELSLCLFVYIDTIVPM